jgi:hypothetical protein
MVTRSVLRSDIENYAYFTPLDGKRALVKGWDKGKEAKPRDQIRGNAGLLLEHAGLSDIDLDSPEIKAMLPRFVPTSTLTLGRGGVPSHYLYSGALPNDEGMKDLDGNRMVEVRHRGKQVMWAGSVHPDTGQEIEVLNEGPLLPVPDQEDILKAYTAAMIAKYLPTGDRHSLAMAYAGYLLRQGLEEDDVCAILEAAWDYHSAPREAFNDLLSIVADTKCKVENDQPATGGNTLTREVPGMVEALSKAWGWDRVLTPEEKDEVGHQERRQRAKDAWPQCEALARKRDILCAVYETIKADGLIGEMTNAKLLTLGAVSLLRGEPISAIIKGTSSVGKSEVIKRVTEALPAEMIVERQSMSERALAYMGKDGLKNKILVVYELGGLGAEGKESLEMAKQILSEGCLKRQIAEGTNKGVHGKLVEVDGPTALWTTTTRVKTDYELLGNRVFELTPDDSRPQTRSIIKNVFEDGRTEVDFGPIKALFTWIWGQDNRVVIPFGPALGELLPDSSVRMRREAVRVRDLIRAHAVLHQASRERDKQDRITASWEDYEAVRVLIEDIVGATAEKSVRSEVRTTVHAAKTLIESEEHDHAGVTISEMGAVLDRDYSTTSRRIKNASPYLVELEDKRGRSKQFGIGADLPAEANALPTVDEVCKFACVCGKGGADANHEESCPMSACKTRANLRANFEEFVSDNHHKPFIHREYIDHHEQQADETAVSGNHLQTCKLHPGGCPNPELCVQNCTSFAHDSLEGQKLSDDAHPIDDPWLWEKVFDPRTGMTVPRILHEDVEIPEPVRRDPEPQSRAVSLHRTITIDLTDPDDDPTEVRVWEPLKEKATNPASAHKAIQEIRNDWQGHRLPTHAEWWVGNLEACDTPFNLEAIELALAAGA